MKIGFKAGILCGLMTLALAGSAFAMGPKPDGMVFIESCKLLFNDEQNKELSKLLASQKKETIQLMDQMRAGRDAVHELIRKGEVKPEELKAQITKLSEVEYQLALKRAEFTQAVRKLATAEQLAKLDAFEAKLKQKREQFDAVMRKNLSELPD